MSYIVESRVDNIVQSIEINEAQKPTFSLCASFERLTVLDSAKVERQLEIIFVCYETLWCA